MRHRPHPHDEQRTTNNEQRTTNNEQRTTNNEAYRTREGRALRCTRNAAHRKEGRSATAGRNRRPHTSGAYRHGAHTAHARGNRSILSRKNRKRPGGRAHADAGRLLGAWYSRSHVAFGRMPSSRGVSCRTQSHVVPNRMSRSVAWRARSRTVLGRAPNDGSPSIACRARSHVAPGRMSHPVACRARSHAALGRVPDDGSRRKKTPDSCKKSNL